MKSAITVCLVPEAVRGPFVLHDGLESGCRVAAEHGFDGIEIFPAGPDEVAAAVVRPLLATHGLALAAIGFRTLSMRPASVGPVKALLRRGSLAEARSVIDRARAAGAESARPFLMEWLSTQQD